MCERLYSCGGCLERVRNNKALTLRSPSWVALCSFFGSRSVESVNYLYNPCHLDFVDKVRADSLFTPFTGESCGWVFLYIYIQIYTVYAYTVPIERLHPLSKFSPLVSFLPGIILH